MHRSIGVLLLAFALLGTTVQVANAAPTITCFDPSGHQTPCAPASYTECTGDQGQAVSCDPCTAEELWTQRATEQPLMDRIWQLERQVAAKDRAAQRLRFRAWEEHQKVRHLRATVRRLQAQLASQP